MKIIHIATTDFGGAAQGLLNLHYALLKHGVESKILVADKNTSNGSIYQMDPNYQLFEWSNNVFLRRIQYSLRKRGRLRTKIECWNDKIQQIQIPYPNFCFTSPITQYDITSHPLVEEADIIHLHWVGNFLDYQSFFKKIKKPVVWTLRDDNPGLGGFHYTLDKKKYEYLYKDIEDSFIEIKRQAIMQHDNMALIALSDEMVNFCSKTDFLSNKEIYKVYNPIDSDKYNYIDQNIARNALNLDYDSFVISFVSVSLMDPRKCLKQLLEAIKSISFPIKLLCVGINDFFTEEQANITCFGRIDNTQLLSLVYSASDIFLTPSLQESFGKTTIEAMLCGTPVISTKTGVATEIIDDSCGAFLDDVAPHTIADAIQSVSQIQFDRKNIQNRVRALVDPNTIAEKHIDIYKALLTCTKQQ